MINNVIGDGMLKKTLTMAAMTALMATPAWAADVTDNAQAVTQSASAEMQEQAAQQVEGFATDFSQPDKKSYNKGEQVIVESQLINEENRLILYPQVVGKNSKASVAINDDIKNFVASIEQKYPKVMSLYDIKADGDGVFSFVTFTNDASVDNSKADIVGYTYNTKTGQAMTLADFGKFNVSALNKALLADPYVKEKLGADFKGLTELPTNFYVAQGKTVYSIIPEGTVLPAEEGTLFVPLNAKK